MSEEKLEQQECTHVCSSCGLACDEKKDGKLTLEETLNLVGDLDSAELLKALEDF